MSVCAGFGGMRKLVPYMGNDMETGFIQGLFRNHLPITLN